MRVKKIDFRFIGCLSHSNKLKLKGNPIIPTSDYVNHNHDIFRDFGSLNISSFLDPENAPIACSMFIHDLLSFCDVITLV